MGLGAPSIATNQKREAQGSPGPPFLLTSAAEGLSVDPVTGKIVLGTDGTYGTPDRFTTTRVVEASNQQLLLQDTTSGGPGQGSFNQIGSDRNLISSPSGNIGLQSIYTDVSIQFVLFDFANLSPGLTLATGLNDVNFVNADGLLGIKCGAQTTSVRIDLVNQRMIMFDPAVADNGQTLQVNGNMSLRNDGILAAIDFPLTAPFSSSDLAFGLFIGSNPGDAVLLGIDPASVLPNSCFTAWVSAADTVTVRFNNYSAGAQDPPVGNFKVSVIKII